MHDVRWERWLDELTKAYFVAAFRPELPGTERLRAAGRGEQALAHLAAAGTPAGAYLVGELSAADTQRRNAAARALSAHGNMIIFRYFVQVWRKT